MQTLTMKTRACCRLMRFDKPIGIFLLLWPTLWALFSARFALPSVKLLSIFIAGVVVMRSAGCVINDFADRRVDGAVKRTAARPLATGELKPHAAVLLFIALCLVGLLLIATLNLLTIKIACIAVALTFVYPFMKRYTHLPQVVLGLAFACSVPMAFAASVNHIPPRAWWLFAATVFWTIGYDTQYAMADRADDLKIGVKSTAILFGRFDLLAIGICQVLTLTTLVWFGILSNVTFGFFVGLAAAGLLFARQSWTCRKREPAACFHAFLNNHWVGTCVFIGLLCSIKIFS